jgi:hypothetical protein
MGGIELLIVWGLKNAMVWGFMTCLEMCGNGVKMYIKSRMAAPLWFTEFLVGSVGVEVGIAPSEVAALLADIGAPRIK